MKLKSAVAAIAVATIAFSTMGDAIVVDSGERRPVVNAAVFDAQGHNIGATDSYGRLPDLGSAFYPLTVRHMSYLPVTIEYGTDTVEVLPMIYELPEVEYIPSMDNMLLTVYSRTYYTAYDASGKERDTITAFSDGIIQFLLPMHKRKDVEHRTVNARSYVEYSGIDRKTKEPYDSFKMVYKEPPLLSMCITMPSVPSMLYEKSCKGLNLNSSYEVVNGKQYPIVVWRRDPNYVSLQLDELADKKDHKYCPWLLKMLGLTMEVTDMIGTETYKARQDNRYTMADFISFSGLIEADLKGRWFKKVLKKELKFNMYVELYAIDHTYLSNSEAKEWNKRDISDPTADITPPSFAPPLDDATRRLITKANANKKISYSSDPLDLL